MNHTLLFGNGLNLLSESPLSWNSLLNELENGSNKISNDTPNTMKYEKILLDRSSSQLKKNVDEELSIKNRIAELMTNQKGNKYYSEIIEMGFDNYLTTNYDNAFCETYNGEQQNASTEGLYSLRRYLSLRSSIHKATKLWHIHGEIEHPKSIMLGLDHYCGSISKIDGYIKGKYKFKANTKKMSSKPMTEKINNMDFDHFSWVELFFNSHIHILGLSLDYSETDLWWVLNKRARLMRSNSINNNVFYYESNIPKSKKELLESMEVTVIEEIRNGDAPEDYRSAHSLLVEKLNNNLATSK